MKTKEELEDELGDWHATFPGKNASEVCDMIATSRNERDMLKAQLAQRDWDIDAYRGALGYTVPGDHTGKLSDGTVPQCGICNSEHRKTLEMQLEQAQERCSFMKDALKQIAKGAVDVDRAKVVSMFKPMIKSKDITKEDSLIAAIEGSYEGMSHSDLVLTCKMLARGRAHWQSEAEQLRAQLQQAEERCSFMKEALKQIANPVKRGYEMQTIARKALDLFPDAGKVMGK